MKKLNSKNQFAVVLLILTLMQVSCKKDNKESSSNQSNSQSIKLNPEGCSVTEVYVTNNSTRTLSKRDYFNGEKLDSSVFYSTDGSTISVVYYNIYTKEYKESVSLTAQRKLSSKGFYWYDSYNRPIRQRAEDANGTVIYDNSYEYTCQ